MTPRNAPDAPKITLSELLTRIENLDTPDADLAPYIIQVPSSTGRIEPSFEPNPSTVTELESGLEGGFLISGFNRRYRRKRNKIYRQHVESGWSGPIIVDEGDSWFQYPWKLEEIIDFLAQDQAIYSLSGAGHTLGQMIEQNEALRAVGREGADVFLLSAGGNDLFEGGNIANLIEPVFAGATANDLVGARFDAFVIKIIAQYRQVLRKLHRAFPNLLMIIHGYAAAYSQDDKWIGRPLTKAGIPERDGHNRVVQVMLDKFNAAQIALSKEAAFNGKLLHADLRPLRAAPGDWFDEIHMGPAQNKAAADIFRGLIDKGMKAGGLESGDGDPEPELPGRAVAAHAAELMGLDEATLMAELDERLKLIARDPGAADMPSSPLLVLAGGLESGETKPPSGLARRLLRRWETELYDLICGDDPDDVETRDKLRGALGVDNQSLIAFVTGWLVSGPLGVSALLAGVLAAILVKRFGSATHEEVCSVWKDRLDGDAGAGADGQPA